MKMKAQEDQKISKGPGFPKRAKERTLPSSLKDLSKIFSVRKKAKLVHPLEPLKTRHPDPLPLSWTLPIEPYDNTPKLIKNAVYIENENVLSFNLKEHVTTVRRGAPFIGILIDPPWKVDGKPGGDIIPDSLRKLKISETIIPNGLIFIWTETEFIPAIMQLMNEWNFTYVENFVWVKRFANLQILKQGTEAKPLRRSKMTLLMFRTHNDEHLELRHQRNPDVIFDILHHDEDLLEEKPKFIYDVIETLLPYGSGNFLELWSKKGRPRTGWTSIYEKKLF